MFILADLTIPLGSLRLAILYDGSVSLIAKLKAVLQSLRVTVKITDELGCQKGAIYRLG